MLTSETPSWRTVVRSSCAHSRASAAPRRSGSVTISTSGVPPRLKSTSEAPEPWIRPDSPTWISFAASSSRWARWMRTSPSRPLARERDVVLADLVALRVVGIEVVLAVEDRARRDLAAERQRDLQRVADRLLVGHRQRPGMGEADRAGVDVRLVAEGELAAAEHLRPGRELDVDLEPDHGLVASGTALSSRHGCSRRPGVEADRPLERVGGVEQPRLGERRARRSGSRPAARAAAVGLGEPGRDRDCRWASRSPRPAFGESGLLDAAHALERAIGFDTRPPGGGRDERDGCSGYEAVIGLEIHVQLSTRTKMFCGCELSFGDEPNVHTCPVCLAHPGTLPVDQRAGGPLRAADRAGAGLRGRAALDLPPQELLLSRQPEGLPDQPVRHPAGARAAGSATSASTASTSRRTPRS